VPHALSARPPAAPAGEGLAPAPRARTRELQRAR